MYALLAALFAALTAIFSKVGLDGVESNLALAIRTSVVLLMSWIIVWCYGKPQQIKSIDRRSWFFILLSALATGFSWIFFFMALQQGPASVVVPIDRLSMVVMVVLAFLFLKEKPTKTALWGLILIITATLLLALLSF